MKSFIVKLTGITLAIALIGWLVFSLAFPEYYLPVLPFLLLFFYLTTVGIHGYQFKMAQKNAAKFTRSSMIVTTFKLLLYSVVAVIYVALDKENALPFVICLMLLYIIYTAFEVIEITKLARSTGKK